jgi:hypothetical protein
VHGGRVRPEHGRYLRPSSGRFGASTVERYGRRAVRRIAGAVRIAMLEFDRDCRAVQGCLGRVRRVTNSRRLLRIDSYQASETAQLTRHGPSHADVERRVDVPRSDTLRVERPIRAAMQRGPFIRGRFWVSDIERLGPALLLASVTRETRHKRSARSDRCSCS